MDGVLVLPPLCIPGRLCPKTETVSFLQGVLIVNLLLTVQWKAWIRRGPGRKRYKKFKSLKGLWSLFFKRLRRWYHCILPNECHANNVLKKLKGWPNEIFGLWIFQEWAPPQLLTWYLKAFFIWLRSWEDVCDFWLTPRYRLLYSEVDTPRII